MATNKKLTEDVTASKTFFPFQKQATLDEILFQFIRLHSSSQYSSDVNGISDREKVGCLLVDSSVFSYSTFYEILECKINFSSLSKYISRLIKSGYVKSVTVQYDTEVRNIYYLTKAGFVHFSSHVGNVQPFHAKTGKRLKETAMHDYGVGSTYLSFICSPFEVTPVYEAPTMYDTATMPSGKAMKRSLRPDALLIYRSPLTSGTIYVEHDTNSESTQRMTAKLDLYCSHNILSASMNGRKERQLEYTQNMILYTFRNKYNNRPHCFRTASVKKILTAMDDTMSIDTIQEDSLAPLIKDFENWTPACKRHWRQRELLEHYKSLENHTNPYLIKYLKYIQRNAAQKKRNSMFRILKDEYDRIFECGWDYTKFRKIMLDSSAYVDGYYGYYNVILEMLTGYPVAICAYNNLDRLLGSFFMEDYPQTVNWLKRVLEPYYGEITYKERCHLFPANRIKTHTDICMHNIFKTSTNEILAIEYLSCDLSALLRFYAITKFVFDLENFPFKCIYLVDSPSDARTILDMIDRRFKQGLNALHHSNLYDIVFLSLNGEYLFTIDENNKEVKVLWKF